MIIGEKIMPQSAENKTFEINVSPVPAARVIGIKIRTDMSKATVDCPKLWHETFAPRMQEVDGFNGTAYGVSQTVDCQAGIFDYWAAVPAAPDAPIPAGMEALDMPAGLYAQCRVESLADIGAAYNFVYLAWPPSQTEFTLDYTARCYEFYPADSMETGVFYIYVMVNKK